jgi:hypothetical protein
MATKKQVVYLDTSAVTSTPSVIALRPAGVELRVPDVVVNQLSSPSGSNQPSPYSEVLSQGLTAGNLTVAATPAIPLHGRPGTYVARLNSRERAIITIATHRALEHHDEHVVIASSSPEIRAAAKLAPGNIEVVSPEELQAKLSATGESEPTVQAAVSRARGADTRRLVIAATAGALIVSAGQAAYFYRAAIAGAIKPLGVAFVIVISAAVLYVCRQRFRLMYGVAEFLFGFTVCLAVALPNSWSIGSNWNSAASVISGIYVMVRGLDNIGIGLDGSRMNTLWTRVFGAKAA